MNWYSTFAENGAWFWWAILRGGWAAWVIDDSVPSDRKTEYRIAVSVDSTTFFSRRKFFKFQDAKVAAVELYEQLRKSPLDKLSGHFSKPRRKHE